MIKGNLVGLQGFLRLRVLHVIRFFQEFLGKLILERSLPQVPVDTGALRGSGQVYISGQRYMQVGSGPNVNHFTIPSKRGVVIINFSQARLATKKAKVYFNFAGKKWFDYSLKQEREKGWLFLEMRTLSGLVQTAMKMAIAKAKS